MRRSHLPQAARRRGTRSSAFLYSGLCCCGLLLAACGSQSPAESEAAATLTEGNPDVQSTTPGAASEIPGADTAPTSDSPALPSAPSPVAENTGGASGEPAPSPDDTANGGSTQPATDPMPDPLPTEPTVYRCTQLFGGGRDKLWFDIFEPRVNGDAWQGVFLSGNAGGFIDGWASPDNTNFGLAPESPCSERSDAPDRIVFTLAGWTEKNQQEFYLHITSIVEQLIARFPLVKRIELATAVRSLGNQICHNDIKTTILPETDAAIEQVVADFPELVFVGSKFEAASCSYFSGHNVTAEGAMGFAKSALDYYAAPLN